MTQPVFDETDDSQSKTSGRKRNSGAYSERNAALNDQVDRIPVPLKLIIAALMGASLD